MTEKKSYRLAFPYVDESYFLPLDDAEPDMYRMTHWQDGRPPRRIDLTMAEFLELRLAHEQLEQALEKLMAFEERLVS